MNEVNKQVNLTIYEWHKLLSELEYIRRICNRDQEVAENLWEKIATQLSGKEQVVYGSVKHRKLAPELFIVKEDPIKEDHIKEEPIIKKTFWQYLNPFAKQ